MADDPVLEDGAEVCLRSMEAADVPAADVVFKLAFGKEFGLPDPMAFRGDAGLVRNRFLMYPEGCVVAERGGRVVGFSIVSRWGSVGVFGPVCVHPDHWNRGLARRLVGESVARFDAWGCRAAGLFTNPGSPRHLRLYQAFGFWPRHLTLVMARGTAGVDPAPDYASLAASPGERAGLIEEAKEISTAAFAGLDLGREIESVVELGYGDTLLLREGGRLAGFAVCHYGKGSEGGSAALYVKVAQIRPGAGARAAFLRLLQACKSHAARLGFARILAGVNTGRHDAYRTMLDYGFRSEFHGVRMHRPLIDICDTADCYAIDDWR